MSVYLYMVLWWCLQWTNDLISRAGLQLLSTEELYEMMPFSVIAYTTMCDTVYKFMTNQFMQIQHKEGSRTTTWPLSRFTWFDVFFLTSSSSLCHSHWRTVWFFFRFFGKLQYFHTNAHVVQLLSLPAQSTLNACHCHCK